MVDEEKLDPSEEYQEVMVEEPEREMELEDVGPSLSEAEEDSSHETPIQTALRYLQPKFKNKRMEEVSQPILKSRIFPDNFLDLNYFLSMYMIEEHEGDSDIDILGIVTGNQAVTSIAYEGRERVEILEAMGAAREQEMAELSKELGLG